MPPTLTRPLPIQAVPSAGRTAVGWLAAGVVAMLGAALAGQVLEPPSTVDLRISNERAEAVTVVVTDPAGGPELPVATVDPGEERVVEGVLDQGDAWDVRFRVAGAEVGSVGLRGDELASTGNEITIPAAPAPEGAAG